jgi:nucleoside-diphosphate-sugar epimerase
MTILAITGGTGFVGRHLLRLAHERGFAVRALARSSQPAEAGVEWVAGSLSDRAALDQICTGADAVIHLAGVINPLDARDLTRGNVDGTSAMIAATAAAGVPRFVHVSSLSAREPGLSLYGASKAAAEALFTPDLPFDWTIVRPPGVYGPGDRETLALFQMVAFGVALLPVEGRLSMIEVSDLARALLALAQGGASRQTVEIDDGTPGGVTHREFAALIGAALGRAPLSITVPGPVLRGVAAVATAIGRVRRTQPRLSTDRARYLAHSDWVARGDNLAGLWAPRVELGAGLKVAADWYRSEGWL